MEQDKSVEVAGWEEVERAEELLKNAETVKVSGVDDEQCLALVGKLLACPNLKQLDFSANKKLDSLTILKAIEMVLQTRKYQGLAPCEMKFATFNLQSMIDEARKGIDLPEDWNAENEAWYAPLVVLTDHLRANRANLAGNEASSRMELVMRVRLHLRLSKFKKEQPQVLSVPIEKPVFILGLFRSGTSLLFNLLSLDKAVRSPRLWELWNPLPPPKEETYETDERIFQTQGILDHLFASSLKGFEKIHFMKSDWPEECSHILRHLFVLGELSFSNSIPPYTEWLDQQSYEAIFKAHKEFLQVLSFDFAPKSHWLLKCPYHMWNIPELLQVYPDARFVWCHREPAESIASGMSLFSFVASKTYKSFDQVQEGPRMSEKLVEGLLKMTDHCTSGLINPSNIVHVNYKDLVSKPLDVVRQVYTHLSLPLTEATEQAAQAFLDANPKGKHGQHAYDLSEYGVSQDELNARLAPYFSASFLQQ